MAAIATRLAISSCNPTHSTRVALHAQTLPFSQLLQSISQNLQLQSRIAGESQHREFIFFCAQPCQCVPSPPVAMPHSTDAPSNRPATTLAHSAFQRFFVKSSSGHSLLRILPSLTFKGGLRISDFEHSELQSLARFHFPTT